MYNIRTNITIATTNYLATDSTKKVHMSSTSLPKVTGKFVDIAQNVMRSKVNGEKQEEMYLQQEGFDVTKMK